MTFNRSMIFAARPPQALTARPGPAHSVGSVTVGPDAGRRMIHWPGDLISGRVAGPRFARRADNPAARRTDPASQLAPGRRMTRSAGIEPESRRWTGIEPESRR